MTLKPSWPVMSRLYPVTWFAKAYPRLHSINERSQHEGLRYRSPTVWLTTTAPGLLEEIAKVGCGRGGEQALLAGPEDTSVPSSPLWDQDTALIQQTVLDGMTRQGGHEDKTPPTPRTSERGETTQHHGSPAYVASTQHSLVQRRGDRLSVVQVGRDSAGLRPPRLGQGRLARPAVDSRVLR